MKAFFKSVKPQSREAAESFIVIIVVVTDQLEEKKT